MKNKYIIDCGLYYIIHDSPKKPYIENGFSSTFKKADGFTSPQIVKNYLQKYCKNNNINYIILDTVQP